MVDSSQDYNAGYSSHGSQEDSGSTVSGRGINLTCPECWFKFVPSNPPSVNGGQADEVDMEPDDHCDEDKGDPSKWQIGFKSGHKIEVDYTDPWTDAFQYVDHDHVAYVVPVYEVVK